MTQYLLIFKTSENIRHLSCMIMTHSHTHMYKATHIYTFSLLVLLFEIAVEVLMYTCLSNHPPLRKICGIECMC